MFKRRDKRSEAELLESLQAHSRELDLDAEKGTGKKLFEQTVRASAAPGLPGRGDAAAIPLQDVVAKRPDLAGLPLTLGSDCRADGDLAGEMTASSRFLRRALSEADVSPHRHATEGGFTVAASYLETAVWPHFYAPDQQGHAVRMLSQVLQGEELAARWALVHLLARVSSAEATAALARRAVFDPSPAVREEAVLVLRGRSADDARRVFLDGLRYPWPPAADHAAEALVALRDRAALPRLVEALDRPDPCTPETGRDGKPTVAELVRVNHLRNCLLCHEASAAATDPVRGPIPTPGQRLPLVYYDSFRGDFVRADTTYLRQDFSARQLVDKADPWPRRQRFDYVVRRRPLSADEAKKSQAPSAAASYPQREAVLFALRELTGKDVGTRSKDWAALVK